ERKIQLSETDNIGNYLQSSLNDAGWGFRDNQYLNDSDIISTFSAIELAYSISEIPIIINKKVGEFINSTWSLGSYRLTNNSLIITPETTFYGVRAYLGMNMSYNIIELGEILLYFSSLYNLLDVESLVIKIENEVGKDTIQDLKQIDSKMEQFFRYKLIEVPEIEEL
ncbi:unnamed protein product, partial [marine sediment metagenome]